MNRIIFLLIFCVATLFALQGGVDNSAGYPHNWPPWALRTKWQTRVRKNGFPEEISAPRNQLLTTLETLWGRGANGTGSFFPSFEFHIWIRWNLQGRFAESQPKWQQPLHFHFFIIKGWSLGVSPCSPQRASSSGCPGPIDLLAALELIDCLLLTGSFVGVHCWILNFWKIQWYQ